MSFHIFGMALPAAALLAAAGAGLLLVTAVLLTLTSRWRRRRLQGRQSAAELRRAAEHIHLVAQACQRHTGNAELGATLHRLAIATLEKAVAQAPRDADCRRLLQEYQETAIAIDADRLAAHAGREEDEVALSRARMLLIEAARLLNQIERDGIESPAALQPMRQNLQQARRTLELRLRLRHAAQNEALDRHHVYQRSGA